MGSLLGPTISEFYMSHIENKIFKTIITKPKIYVCYVEEIFITTHSYDKISKLKQTVEKTQQTWPIKWNAVSSRQWSYRHCCMDALNFLYIADIYLGFSYYCFKYFVFYVGHEEFGDSRTKERFHRNTVNLYIYVIFITTHSYDEINKL